ncbi:MAG: ADP-ribosylation factor-like protein [Promethearchaeota archaeon]
MADSNLKIALIGLDNAGKTSIIRTLNRTFNIKGKITPTKSVERTTFTLFSHKGSIWDYGGQQSYRSDYLENPDRYLTDIQYIFFVVDVQDGIRFPHATDYFKQVYEIIHGQNPSVIVTVLFHKMDPEISDSIELNKSIDRISLEFQHIVENNEIGFYRTSIYDPISLLNSVSLPILGNQPIYNMISMLLAEFAMSHSIEYIAVLVNELFELGSFRLKSSKENFLQASRDFYYQVTASKNILQSGEYDVKGYKFVIVNRNVLDYNYCLNYAHPIGQLENLPSKEELRGLFQVINEKIEEFHPSLF